MPRRIPGFNLRTKLALVSLVLLALPWAGWNYVREMERFLLEGQEQTLLATARAVATALHDRPQLMQLRPPLDTELRRQAEEELRRLAAERGETQPPAEPSGRAGGEAAIAPGAGAGAGAAPQPGTSVITSPQAGAVIGRESEPPSASGAIEIDAILRGVQRSTARLWVVNRDYRVLALAGKLARAPEPGGEPGVASRALGWLLQSPSEAFDDARPEDVLATGKEIAQAIQGSPATRVRRTADDRAVVVSAAHPIWAADRVVGAVVAEETTNAILSVRTRALERLVLITLTVFALAAAVLGWFATRISSRIRALRDEAEGAIDARGRLIGEALERVARRLAAVGESDEIGDLSRSFSAMLARLAQHNAYLETLASRLSHELRTPVAVVRSSLENLKLARSPKEARPYVERAEDGLARLSTILNRMTEATRLEASLQTAERERFDLAAVVAGCVNGYRLAYPQQRIDFASGDSGIEIEGSPDLIAQLLDKLVANAAEFSPADAPIAVALARLDGAVELSVANRGPLLPGELQGRLFNSMVSARKEGAAGAGAGPHLGLGLYIARLIAEYHRGAIRAENLEGGDGVRLTVTLPLASAPAQA